MNIWKLLSTRERFETIKYVLDKSEIGVEEVFTALGLSKGFISQFLKLLDEEGVLKRENRKYVVNDTPIVRSMKIFINTASICPTLFENKKEWMKSVGLYGSFSRGTNNEDSDIDLWIKVAVHPGERMIATLERTLSDRLGRPVHILVLTPERLKRLKKEDTTFYNTLTHSLVLWGEGIE